MTFKPAHKENKPEHAPGQIVNPLRMEDYALSSDLTLADYIARKQRQDAFDSVAKEKKLTFEEWWREFSRRYSLDDVDSLMSDFKQAWKAAQENK